MDTRRHHDQSDISRPRLAIQQLAQECQRLLRPVQVALRHVHVVQPQQQALAQWRPVRLFATLLQHGLGRNNMHDRPIQCLLNDAAASGGKPELNMSRTSAFESVQCEVQMQRRCLAADVGQCAACAPAPSSSLIGNWLKACPAEHVTSRARCRCSDEVWLEKLSPRAASAPASSCARKRCTTAVFPAPEPPTSRHARLLAVAVRSSQDVRTTSAVGTRMLAKRPSAGGM